MTQPLEIDPDDTHSQTHFSNTNCSNRQCIPWGSSAEQEKQNPPPFQTFSSHGMSEIIKLSLTFKTLTFHNLSLKVYCVSLI